MGCGVTGDILGLSITGLGLLVKMPLGCGEQNMINFAPNVYVLQRLAKSIQRYEEIRSKALSYMMEGDELSHMLNPCPKVQYDTQYDLIHAL